MIKRIIISIVIMVMTQLAFANQVTKPEDKIVAKIDGKPVYESEIREKIQAYMEMNALSNQEMMSYDRLDKEVKEEIIKSIVVGDLIVQEAKQEKVKETLEYKKGLQMAENQLMQKIFIEQIVKKNLTEEKLQAKYKEIVAEQANKYEYKVSHILVNTEEEAREIEKKLSKGESFAALAKQYSLDNNKEEGGSLAYFSNGQMVPSFEQAVEKLKVGEISGPIKTDFGYHIIKLEDKRKLAIQSFEELKNKISEEISAQFIQEYIEQLKAKNKVEFL